MRLRLRLSFRLGFELGVNIWWFVDVGIFPVRRSVKLGTSHQALEPAILSAISYFVNYK